MRGRQHWHAIGQRQMQADGEAGVGAGHAQALLQAGLAHHQAGRGKHALAVRALDAGIRFGGQAQIIGGEDQASHGVRGASSMRPSAPSR
jgi:hypothetical protein